MTPEEKLNYLLNSRTRFKVRVTYSEGREPVIPGSTWLKWASTLAAAQQLYITARNKSDLGGSQFSDGEVYDEMGQYVARISYNGRLWSPEPWTPLSVAIAEAPGHSPEANEYIFDVKLFASIRVKAATEAEAREMLREHVNAASANFGAWPNGDPIIGEASVDDDEPDLIEKNGEAV